MPSVPAGSSSRRPGAAAPAGTSFAGRTVCRCLVGDKLGRGATSQVFRARHLTLGKDVALKILSDDESGEARRRILSEARAIGRLDHENIVKVLDVADHDGLLCILMELVAGRTLEDRLADETFIPPRQALRIAAQIGRALEAAHAAKVVHRDVKPTNVMLSGPPGQETVRVLDFGLACENELRRVGTPLYMSPEAAQGRRIDEKSDVYSLGICLYRMLTGTFPFTGASVKELLAAQINAEMPPLAQRRAQLGKTYDELLRKLLVKSKGYRPTAGEAADMIEDLADDLEERESGIRRDRKRRRRAASSDRRANPGVLAGLAVGAIGAAWLLLSAAEEPATPVVAAKPETVPTVDPAKVDFEEVERFVAANPAEPGEAIRRWASIEARYPATRWATEAELRRAAAETADREMAKRPDYGRKKSARLIKAFDFAGAQAVLDEMEPPPEVDSETWVRHCKRVDLLAKDFYRRVDAALRTSRGRAKAQPAFPEAAADEVLVGVEPTGARVEGPRGKRRIEWAKASPEELIRCLGRHALDNAVVEDDLLLAALAEELVEAAETRRKLVKEYSDLALLAAGTDPGAEEAVAARIGSLF
jgi:tRNA A-37 threonylcarbamoyl transferase component Bud32